MSVLLVLTSPKQVSPTLVTIAGEVDIASAPALRRHLQALPDRSTVLELSGVGLLSAAGVTEVVELRNRLIRADARLALAGASPWVRRILAVTGIDGTIVLADTVADALRLLAAESPPRSPPHVRFATPPDDGHRRDTLT